MARTSTRRRLLQLSGCAVVGLSGCADAIDRVAEGEAVADGPAGAGVTAAPSTESSDDEVPSTSSSGTRDPPPTDGTEAGGGTPSTSASLDLSPPGVSFVDAPLPARPGDRQYATMGHPEEAPTARLFGNWKCPYTREFVVERLDEVVDRFVRPGRLAIEFRGLAYRSSEPFLGPDAPRAARAGLGVWHADPASYWTYVGYVFANQPPEREEWATVENLLTFADAAGVEGTDRVRRSIVGDDLVEAVRSTTAVAAAVDVSAVPRIEVDGVVTAPTVDFETSVEQLERAAGG